jgi:N-acylneuraminate cytidylyltransferase
MSRYVALICARSGSKSLPGKNIKPLNGVPLIGWSIKVAKQVERISRVIVSTDSEEIAKIALEYGAEVPFMRPNELAQDDSPEWLVWKHALDYLKNQNNEIDGLVVVPTTAPLRSKEDINNCINEFEKGNVDVVITVSNAHRSPYFNMVKTNQNGFSSLVISTKEKITRRQEVPEVFDMTTVAYVAKPGFVLKNHGIFDGRVRCVHIPSERSLDIDTPLDFKIAECLVNNQ